VGTAGSTSLVLQTVLPALLAAGARSTLVLEGGTHNPMAPPYDFLAAAFFPVLRQMGAKLASTLERYGFFPAGGGRVVVHVEPAALTPIAILERGRITGRRAEAVVSKLPISIAERELAVIADELQWPPECLHARKIENSRGPGNAVMLEIQSEHIREVFTAFGKKGLPAEKVARQAAHEAAAYLAADAPVGPHLADQLLIPMALARGGRFRTSTLTDHTKTNIEVVKKFLDVDIQATAERGNIFQITIA
jgi:RNA 3'-terminal phosphate cyclase (ATP)